MPSRTYCIISYFNLVIIDTKGRGRIKEFTCWHLSKSVRFWLFVVREEKWQTCLKRHLGRPIWTYTKMYCTSLRNAPLHNFVRATTNRLSNIILIKTSRGRQSWSSKQFHGRIRYVLSVLRFLGPHPFALLILLCLLCQRTCLSFSKWKLLKDPNKRKQYDEDGVIPFDDNDDETNEESRKSWKDYFDLIFGKLSTDDIDSFSRKYKMSDEEEKDVLENYVKFKGWVGHLHRSHRRISGSIYCCENGVKAWGSVGSHPCFLIKCWFRPWNIFSEQKPEENVGVCNA